MTGGRIVTGDGCALAYRIDGPETAPVLLLSNSLGTAMAMWDAQVPVFIEHSARSRRIRAWGATFRPASARPPASPPTRWQRRRRCASGSAPRWTVLRLSGGSDAPGS
jgi:hypothetical protein